MKTVFKKSSTLLLVLSMLALFGCAYPSDEKASREIAYEEQLQSVQNAINSFRDASGGLLPIKTRDQETDVFIKYPIEFSKIVPAYMEKIPSNAYETGGVFQYVMMDVEENPTVKLVDLRAAERIRELNIRKNINSNSIPFKEAVGDNVYAVDYKKMGIDTPLTVPSPYSDAQLPLVVGGDGNFYVDYSIDLKMFLESGEVKAEQGEDIRFLLAKSHPILPAYSLPYTVNDKNEPIFMK